MIFFIRSSLFKRDVRASKYIHFLDKEDVHYVEWDRENESNDSKYNHHTFHLQAKYGKGWRGIFKFISWNFFIFKTLYSNLNQFKIIQISDLDCYPGAAIFRLIGKKIVFDSYDFFTDSRVANTESKAYKLLYRFEMFCMKYSDLLILPVDFRKYHLNFTHHNLLICENVPLIHLGPHTPPIVETDKLKIVYAGTLEENNRGLEWIPSLAAKFKDRVHFYVAGSGSLTPFFEKAAKENSNLTFLGKLSHREALALQEQSDLIFAFYLTTVKNNVMAAPNKFYESLFLGVPLITNKGVLFSEVIETEGLGFAIEENFESIIEFIQNISSQEIKIRSDEARNYWSIHYENYLVNKYKLDYQKRLAVLTSL